MTIVETSELNVGERVEVHCLTGPAALMNEIQGKVLKSRRTTTGELVTLQLDSGRKFTTKRANVKRAALPEPKEEIPGSPQLRLSMEKFGPRPGILWRSSSSLIIPRLDLDRPLGTSLDGATAMNNREHPMRVLERGKVQMQGGNYDDAKILFEEALAGQREGWGDDDEKTLVAMSMLGVLLFKMGDMEAAKELYVEALAGHRRCLGDTHPDTLACINNLGLLEKKMGDLEAAELLYEEALAGSREALGEAHPDTLQSIKNLAALLYSMGQFAEALPLFRESLAGRRAQLGAEHARTRDSAVGVYNALSKLGDSKGAAAVRAEFGF